jgi:membrane protease YdiL (CAAX protease family)
MTAQAETARPVARWRPPVAVAVVVVGLVVAQAVAAAVILAAGESDEATAAGLVLADVIVLGVILVFEGLWALLAGGFSNVEEDAELSTAATLMILFAVAVTAPIVEELAFRGYLFPALTGWRGPWVGAALTAILFGAAHIASSPLVALPALAVFGFGACLLYWFTGSLLPCVGLHAANNAIVMSVGGAWTWQVPVALVGCVAVAVLLLLPFARGHAPERE